MIILRARNSMSNSRTVSVVPILSTMSCSSNADAWQEGYKGQGGWDTVLGRFPRGKGTLLDLEFLEDGMLAH